MTQSAVITIIFGTLAIGIFLAPVLGMFRFGWQTWTHEDSETRFARHGKQNSRGYYLWTPLVRVCPGLYVANLKKQRFLLDPYGFERKRF